MSDASNNTATLRYALWLGATLMAAALLTTLAFHTTRDRIAAQQRQAEQESLHKVLPVTLHDNDLLGARFTLSPDTQGYDQLPLLGLSTTRSGYMATIQGQTTAVILPLETAQGYGGPIVLLIGITADGKITGVRVQQHAETPGLGDKIDIHVSPWITVFDHRNLADTPEPLWHVKKEGGDFDQFTGATITPRAVVGAVYNALKFFELNKDKLLMQRQEAR